MNQLVVESYSVSVVTFTSDLHGADQYIAMRDGMASGFFLGCDSFVVRYLLVFFQLSNICLF